MTDNSELQHNNDKETRGFRRELLIVAIVVGAFILIGAVWTALNGPEPIPGAVDVESAPATAPSA